MINLFFLPSVKYCIHCLLFKLSILWKISFVKIFKISVISILVNISLFLYWISKLNLFNLLIISLIKLEFSDVTFNINDIVKTFGDPNLSIKRDQPERRKSFRARHNCDNPGPKTKARYWSCKHWSRTPVSKM